MTVPSKAYDPVAKEQLALAALCEAHRLFCELPRQHPQEMSEWVDAIHRIQDLLAVRVARAYRPDIFPIKQYSLLPER